MRCDDLSPLQRVSLRLVGRNDDKDMLRVGHLFYGHPRVPPIVEFLETLQFR